VDKLNAALNAAIKTPEAKKIYATFGYEPMGGTPKDFVAHMQAITARWGPVIRDAHITYQ
jgi:tripartite-type tricarboxylate transporter receptor subunit TctC